MELYQSHDNYIIQDGNRSLWCNRLDGSLLPRRAEDIREAWSPVCRGVIYGLVGKLQFFPGSEWKLIVISKRTLLGTFPGDHQIYRIDRIAVLPLAVGEVPDIDLDICKEHGTGGKLRKFLQSGDGQQKSLQQTWNTIKFAATNIKGNIKTVQIADRLAPIRLAKARLLGRQEAENTQREFKDKERDKLERRLSEELLKMFNNSDSFYYSTTGDLTNTLRRQFSENYDSNCNIWHRVDERFVWNKVMLEELIESEDPGALQWAVPVIQGYCKIAHCENTFEVDEPGEEITDIQRMPLPAEEFELILISRRSVRRAGTRYKRRGVDDEGDVANYVETEQIVSSSMHNVSFVQVRGSVPVFWSQPGLKYRPPPRLDRGEEETQRVFKKHFEKELSIYGKQVIINLVDQNGREKIISDVFMDNILALNHALLTYITFDFHEYCRGMKFENVAVLVDSISDVIRDMRYSWTDDKGIICDQRSVFRINCMDCLDRTNVVQAAIARQVMETQLKKLGKLLPDQILPANIRTTFQDMWASNGDAISRQYAGTAAMKGDFTRTGERKISGVMKDGYNSANRYYLNRFKAAYRQTVIDLMLGKTPTEDLAALIATMRNGGGDEDQWTMEREECVAQLVLHCQLLLVTDNDEYLGGWALVDPFYTTGGEAPQDQDVVLLLTHEAYYVASYDDEAETITQYERVVLEDLEKIEIGYEPTFFKARHLFIRIHRKFKGQGGYFHTLRTIQYRTPDEARGVLLEIADAFAAARSSLFLGLRVSETRLDRKKSKLPPDVIQISSKRRLSGWSLGSKSKEKDKESTERSDEESLIDSRLREKHAVLLRVAGFPRPHSDPCLSRQCGSELVNESSFSPALSERNSEFGDIEETEDHGLPTDTNSEQQEKNLNCNEYAEMKCIGEYNDLMGSEDLIDLDESLVNVADNIMTKTDFTVQSGSEMSNPQNQEGSVQPLINEKSEISNFHVKPSVDDRSGTSTFQDQEGTVKPLVDSRNETANFQNQEGTVQPLVNLRSEIPNCQDQEGTVEFLVDDRKETSNFQNQEDTVQPVLDDISETSNIHNQEGTVQPLVDNGSETSNFHNQEGTVQPLVDNGSETSNFHNQEDTMQPLVDAISETSSFHNQEDTVQPLVDNGSETSNFHNQEGTVQPLVDNGSETSNFQNQEETVQPLVDNRSETSSFQNYQKESLAPLIEIRSEAFTFQEQEASVQRSIEDRSQTSNFQDQGGSVQPSTDGRSGTSKFQCVEPSNYVSKQNENILHQVGGPGTHPPVCEPTDHYLSEEDQLNAEFMGAPLDTVQIIEPSAIGDDFDFSQSIEAVVETRYQEQQNVTSSQVKSSIELEQDQDDSSVGFDLQLGTAAIRVDQTTGKITRGVTRNTEPDSSEETGTAQTQLAESRSPKLRLFSQSRGRNLIPELRTKLQSISFPSRSRAQRQTQKRQNDRDEGTGIVSGNNVSIESEQKNRKRQCQTRIIEL